MLFDGVIMEVVFEIIVIENYTTYMLLDRQGETPRAVPVLISGIVIRFVSGNHLPLHHKKAFMKTDRVIIPEMVRPVVSAFYGVIMEVVFEIIVIENYSTYMLLDRQM